MMTGCCRLRSGTEGSVPSSPLLLPHPICRCRTCGLSPSAAVCVDCFRVRLAGGCPVRHALPLWLL